MAINTSIRLINRIAKAHLSSKSFESYSSSILLAGICDYVLIVLELSPIRVSPMATDVSLKSVTYSASTGRGSSTASNSSISISPPCHSIPVAMGIEDKSPDDAKVMDVSGNVSGDVDEKQVLDSEDEPRELVNDTPDGGIEAWFILLGVSGKMTKL